MAAAAAATVSGVHGVFYLTILPERLLITLDTLQRKAGLL